MAKVGSTESHSKSIATRIKFDTDEKKMAAVREVLRLRARGKNDQAAAKAVGISTYSFYVWRQKFSHKPGASAEKTAFVEVPLRLGKTQHGTLEAFSSFSGVPIEQCILVFLSLSMLRHPTWPTAARKKK